MDRSFAVDTSLTADTSFAAELSGNFAAPNAALSSEKLGAGAFGTSNIKCWRRQAVRLTMWLRRKHAPKSASIEPITMMVLIVTKEKLSVRNSSGSFACDLSNGKDGGDLNGQDGFNRKNGD